MARSPLAPFVAAALSLATSAALAAGFDTGAEGWTTTSGGDQVWKPTGGNGGGWLQVTDTTAEDFLLNAPIAWLGNWSAYAGGTLSFDAKNVNGDAPDWAPFGEVTLTGTVEDRNQKRMAEDCINQIRGVKDVHNQLRVQGQNQNQQNLAPGQGKSRYAEDTGGTSSSTTSSTASNKAKA